MAQGARVNNFHQILKGTNSITCKDYECVCVCVVKFPKHKTFKDKK